VVAHYLIEYAVFYGTLLKYRSRHVTFGKIGVFKYLLVKAHISHAAHCPFAARYLQKFAVCPLQRTGSHCAFPKLRTEKYSVSEFTVLKAAGGEFYSVKFCR